MGLSSSQARLLSITARLTDNEYRTQRLTNARLKLTDISDAARVQYQNALDSDKFVYMAFDSTGANVKTDLTPAVLYQYQPSKNQYALVNNANNILVSSLDAKNFRETDNLAEFLKRYDCLDNYQTSETVIETKKVRNKDYDNWVAPEQPTGPLELNTDELSQIFKSGSHKCFEEAHNGAGKDYSDCYLHVLASVLIFLKNENYEGPGDHQFNNGPFTTSDNGRVYFAEEDNTDSDAFKNDSPWSWVYGSHIWPANDPGTTDKMQIVSDALQNGYQPKEYEGQYTVMAHDIEDYYGIDGFLSGNEYLENFVGDYYFTHESVNPDLYNADGDKVLNNADKFHKLISNYYVTEDGEVKLKTLQQKAIDIFYLLSDWWITRYKNDQSFFDHDPQYKPEDWDHEIAIFDGDPNYNYYYSEDIYYDVYLPLIDTFQIDMEKLYLMGSEPQENPYEEYRYEQVPVTKYTDKLVIKDPEKAQWYTNLWYRMNGMDEPERVYKNTTDIVNDRQEEQDKTEYLLKLFDIEKQTHFKYYDEIDPRLASSKDWLNNALSQGLVTMQKVGASRTVGNDKFKWSSIIYTNATDIISQKDDTKIAQAEARYTQVLSEVNAKDKVFENKIRKLDTEHNALQTEYNSVKAAMDKNIERSFKAFQG